MSETVSLPRQQARCAFTAIAMGNVLLAMPEELPVSIGRKKLANICGRVTRWLDAVSGEVGERRLPKPGSQAVTRMLEMFGDRAFPKGFSNKRLEHCAAAFWACVVFLWDCRVTCPDMAKTPAWRYLDLASEQFGRLLLEICEGADLAGDKIYEELVW